MKKANKKESYIVLSPDGFPIERDGMYKSMIGVENALNSFVERFKQQGYYSTSNRERIPFDLIKDYCEIIPIKK